MGNIDHITPTQDLDFNRPTQQKSNENEQAIALKLTRKWMDEILILSIDFSFESTRSRCCDDVVVLIEFEILNVDDRSPTRLIKDDQDCYQKM